jgi:hypothetical protein
MYDPLRSTYTLACPHLGETQVRLSSFRFLERLPGTAHPAVFGISFECPCGKEHPALISHHDLDLAPLGSSSEVTFRNVMTASDDALAAELAELAAVHIRAGEWPWSFYCIVEEGPRPITPSSIVLIAPTYGSLGLELLGLAVRCPSCSSLSVNLVSHAHVDIPFWNDRRVGVVDHTFDETPRLDGPMLDRLGAIADFRAALQSEHFDERRLDLEL